LAADANYVSDGYFETMHIAFMRGRAFAESDAHSQQPLAIINDIMAARLWPGEEPVGKRFRTSLSSDLLFEVIGVVKATKQREGLQPHRPPSPQVFLSTEQSAAAAHAVPMTRTIFVRTAMDPQIIALAIQSEIRSIDADIAIPNMVTMEEQVRRSPTGFGVARAAALISAVLGVLVMSLALVGTFGSLSFMVGQRTQEIGIRMALGARRSTVLKMIVGHGLMLVSIGALAGIVLAVELGGVLQVFLFDVSPVDPFIVVSAILLLLTAAGATCLFPARRATQVDPILALKCE
jgi:hypothetical protein